MTSSLRTISGFLGSSIPLSLVFGAFFDARQLMRPQALERLRPLMQRTNRLRVGSIQHVPSLPPHPHQPHIAQHFQMLRHGRLFQTKPDNHIAHRTLPGSEIVQNLASPRFGHSVERIEVVAARAMSKNIYSYIGICQVPKLMLLRADFSSLLHSTDAGQDSRLGRGRRFPQWNCACPNCRALRAGTFHGKARTQTQLAVSADSRSWFLLGASPDLRAQIEADA